jgi:hypothetical protein
MARTRLEDAQSEELPNVHATSHGCCASPALMTLLSAVGAATYMPPYRTTACPIKLKPGEGNSMYLEGPCEATKLSVSHSNSSIYLGIPYKSFLFQI